MGNYWRKGLAVLAAIVVLFSAAQPALAAPPAQRAGFQCEGGVCRLELSLGPTQALLPNGGTAWLEVLDRGLRRLPGEPRLLASEDVVVSLPFGSLVLPNAELALELGPDYRVRSVQGTAELPVPTFGFFDTLEWVAPSRVQLGFDRGANLRSIDAPLADDHHYLYFDVQSGLRATVPNGMELTVPAGQQATFVVDLSQPLVYMNGDVNLRYHGDVAFIREVFAGAPLLEALPANGGMSTSLDASATVLVGQGVSPSVEVRAAYAMDPGMIGQWLRLEQPLLEAEGHVVLSGQGLMLAGQAQSALLPERLLDGAVLAEVFVPFDWSDTGYARIGSELDIPVLGVSRSAAGQMMLPGGAGSPDPVASSAQVQPAPDETGPSGSWWAGRPAQAVDGLWTGAGAVASTMQGGYGRAVEGASQSYQWLSQGMSDGWQYTTGQWCAWTGTCAAASGTTGDLMATVESK